MNGAVRITAREEEDTTLKRVSYYSKCSDTTLIELFLI